MRALGCEVPKSCQGSLAKSLACWVVLLSGGGLFSADAIAGTGDSGTVDLRRVTVTGFRYINYGFHGEGSVNIYSGGHDTDTMERYIERIPDTITDRSASEDGECGGNPVMLATGNKIEQEVDFESGANDGLSLVRTYNHYWSGEGIFGRRWKTNHDYYVDFGNYESGACVPDPILGLPICDHTRAHTIIANRPDGRSLKYTKVSSGRYVSADTTSNTYFEWGVDGKLVYKAEGQDTEIYGNTFYKAAWISERKNLVGDTWTYDGIGPFLTRITHSSGRYIEFIRNGVLLTGVRDPAGALHTYSFSEGPQGSRLLLSHSQSDTNTAVTYHYENGAYPDALTGKSFNGSRYSTFTYDSAGRVRTTEHAGGVDRFEFAYSYVGSTGTTTVTNPLGRVEKYRYVDGKAVGTNGVATTYCPATATNITYDTNNHVDRRTDANGNVIDFDYDAKGRLTKKVEGAGSSAAATWNYTWEGSVDRLKSATLVGQHRTEYTYNADGRVSKVRLVNLSSSGIQGGTRDTTFAYTKHSNGLVSKIVMDGPLPGAGDAITQIYSASGDITSTIDGLGNTATLSAYNGRGQPGSIETPNGARTDYVYDKRGRLLKERRLIDGAWADTVYSYTGSGLTKSITLPDGVKTQFLYSPALRLTSEYRDSPSVLVGGASREERLYAYDAAGNVTVVTTRADTSTRSRVYYDYDELNRLRAQRGNSAQIITYGYDLNGNNTSIEDSFGRTLSITYDALNRPSKVVDPYAKVTTYSYDTAGNITKIVDPRGLETTYVYDGFGQLWRRTSPDSGVTAATYNAYGQQLTEARANGTSTVYSYNDTLGRLTLAAGSDGGQQLFTYEACIGGKQRLCKVVDSAGTLSLTYTPEGKLSSKKQVLPGGTALSQAFAYDATGRIVGISYPGSVSVGYGYLHGKLRNVQAIVNGVAKNVAINATYEPFGPMASAKMGNNFTRSIGRDLDGRVSSINVSNGATARQKLTYGFDANGNITSIVNGVDAGASQTLGYDMLDRVNYFAGSLEAVDLSHDANGNITTRAGMFTQNYSIAGDSNRLLSMTGVPSAPNYSYDASGNMTGKPAGNSPGNYEYDSFNRLAKFSTYNGVAHKIATYKTNALGERVEKKYTNKTTAFAYGVDGLLSAEFAKESNVWTHHIRMGSEYIAFVRGGQVYYVHNDHIGRPEVITNSSAAQVWRAKLGVFGRDVTLDSVGGYNLGFPGQYYDAETGLWYNGRRYYLGGGRYTQPDPLGQNGGINPYIYASGNPVSNIDVYGLVDWEGTALEYGFGTWSGTTYTLTSKCETGNKGHKYMVRVHAGGAGLSVLPSKLQAVVSYVGSFASFSDANFTADPNVFNGEYSSISATIVTGVGITVGTARLGDAKSGLGVSVGFGFGESEGAVIGASKVSWAMDLGPCKCYLK